MTTPFFVRFKEKATKQETIDVFIDGVKTELQMTLEVGETVPHMYKAASVQFLDTKKKPWREAWLESIESEIKYTIEELSPSPQDTVWEKKIFCLHPIPRYY